MCQTESTLGGGQMGTEVENVTSVPILSRVFSPAEIAEAVGQRDAAPLAFLLGVTEAGNFEGSNVLTRRVTPAQVAQRFACDAGGAAELFERHRSGLRQFRARRTPPRPARCSRPIASWGRRTPCWCACPKPVRRKEDRRADAADQGEDRDRGQADRVCLRARRVQAAHRRPGDAQVTDHGRLEALANRRMPAGLPAGASSRGAMSRGACPV